MLIKGEQRYDKDKKLKILLYQQEDKELQQVQNKILVRNTNLTIWAVVFGGLAFLAQIAEVVVSYLGLIK